MKIFLFIVLFVYIFCASCDFRSKEYIKLSAKEKLDCIWSKLNEKKEPLGFYSMMGMSGVFFERMAPSFELKGDELPHNRKKYIHTVGKVAKAKYVSTGDHPFTGVFEGCDNVIIKGSSVKEQDHIILNFTPGLGIKFLRDGAESANLLTMYSVNGQKSRNFFKNDMSNHIPDPKGLLLNSLALKFSTETNYIQALGLKDLSEIDCKGKKIEPHKYPFKLIFKPNKELRNKYSDTDKINYMDQLGNVASGTMIYEVWAVENPNNPERKIGEIITKSEMVASRWGDESLFFRHNLMEDDLKENPEWEEYVPRYSIFGSKHKDKDLEEATKKENL